MPDLARLAIRPFATPPDRGLGSARMDAIDEVLDVFRSENAQGQRNRRVLVLGVAAAGAAFLAHRLTMGDLDTAALTRSDDAHWLGASVLLPFVAPFVVYLAVRRRQSVVRYALAALAVPLLSLGIGLQHSDERRWQREARATFDRYTQRFPQGRPHDVYLINQTNHYLTACAAEGPQGRSSRQFCIEVLVNDAGTDNVEGGFRFDQNDGAEYGFVSHVFYDCFGDTITCTK